MRTKKKLVFYFLVITIFGQLLDGCTTEKGITPKEEFTPQEAQTWFQENLEQPAQNSSISGRREGILDIKKEILWKQAKNYKTEEGTSLIIPVWFENKYRLGKKAVRHLKIYKDKKGVFQHEFVEFLANDEHFKKYGKVNFKNFSGTVSKHDWKTGIIKGYQIEKGTAIGYVSSYSTDQKRKGNSTGGKVEDCGYHYSTYNYNPSTNTYSDYTVIWVSIACYPANSYQWYYSEPYDYYAFVASNYGCEVTNTCVDSNANYYYEPEPQPVDEFVIDQTIGKLCDNLKFTQVGSSFTAEITGLGFTAVNYLTNSIINGELGTVCVEISDYKLRDKYEASQIFTRVFNQVRSELPSLLNSGILAPNSPDIRAKLKSLIFEYLNSSNPGSTFSTGACGGSVVKNTADYGC